MGKVDAVEAVQKLAAAFRQDLRPDTVGVYAERLADLPRPALVAAVDSLIETQKFFPAVGEIRREVTRLCGMIPPPAPVALALVQQADVRESVFRRDGSFAYEERYWRWPEDADPKLVAFARDVIAKVGDPVDDKSGKGRFAWDTGFAKAYDAEVEQHVASLDLSQAKLLPASERPRLAARSGA